MKVKDLITALKLVNPNVEVLVRYDGSIFSTDNIDEHADYNDGAENEYFILAIDKK
jgi:hypothetical protein